MYSNSDLFWDMLKKFQKMRKKQSRNRKFTINTEIIKTIKIYYNLHANLEIG